MLQPKIINIYILALIDCSALIDAWLIIIISTIIITRLVILV